ncbi:amino acid adenylation domain-containing protein (plasmid) [Pantoea agglomerans]|uniref:non-ribosomal peptide synthetase n=1 Tax=Enterobacter agglomerans TaxID=549 RepID=UPI0013C9DB3E|nr:non-ribosomal peptide synthetase [Pantoea agglomerans]NEG64783.1 amino acid adenylation domain-containing protein [Pantoea agglomerans]
MQYDSIFSAFDNHVQNTPNKISVKYQNSKLTYKQLDTLANRLSRAILQNIPEKTSSGKILFCLERSEYTVAVMLACVKIGMIYVPFDPLNPDDRLHYMIEDCDPLLVITNKENAGRQYLRQEVYIENMLSSSADIRQALPNPVHSPAQHDAYIMYTSGSTGKPKGVVITQQGILRLVINAKPFQFSSEAIIAQCGNIAFDASTLEIWGALLNGATLVVVPYETVIDSEALTVLLRAEKITDVFLTVALFNQLVLENPRVFGSLNNVLTGGDALNPKMIKAALCADTPPDNIWNCYGPTENTVCTTIHRITLKDTERDAIPIGRPVSGTQCYVLDTNLNPVMPGEEGELFISGSGLAVEYINKPDKTAEAFLPNPFYQREKQQSPQSATVRIYKTGDRVRMLADGSYDFLGRTDNQVKIRGFRLEPGEVEYQLCQIDAVELALVSPLEHNGQKKLAAWCKSRLSAKEILEIFRQQVPAYMVPSSLLVIEHFPLTANGKIDKHRLPAPHFDTELSTPAQTATEIWLSQIWQQLLSLPHPAGREDNFSSLGGHSLMIVKLKQKIQAELHKDVALTDLFHFAVLAELAAHLDALPEQQSNVTIARVADSEKIPLSSEQLRLWFICHREPEVAHYSIPMAFTLSGHLQSERLAKALDALCQRHDSLRLRIYHSEGSPWQQVAKTAAPLIMETVANAASLQNNINREAHRPFTFGDDPLLRTVLYRLPDGSATLFINIHHIITDGWSMGVFFDELARLYAGDEALTPLEFQFTDYCIWQQTQDHTADLAWWQQRLKDVVPQQLPVRGKATGGVITRYLRLSATLHNQLKEIAVQCQTGLFSITSSALAIVLSRLCASEDVQISSIWANRQHPGQADQIGFFVNTLILRMQVEPERPLIQWLKNNHTQITEGFQHGSAPLSEVLSRSGISSEGNQHPLCSVLLVMQNTDGGNCEGLALAGCRTKPYPLPEEQAKSDLLVNIVPQENGELSIEIAFRAGIWSGLLMESIPVYFQQIFDNMTANLHHPVVMSMDIGSAMRQQQLRSGNPQSCTCPTGSVLAFFDRQVLNAPDAPAVSDLDQQLSYRELNNRANQLAFALQKRQGSLRGKRVVFALGRTADTIALILAIMKTGAVYVPFDPEHPDERLRYILKDCDATCLVVQANHRNRQTICPEYDIADLLASAGSEAPQTDNAALGPKDVAYIMYTSGSTGEPKGVEVMHQGILRLVTEAKPYQVRPNSVMAQAGNIAFDASTLEIWGALLNGAHLIVIPYQTVIDSNALPAALKHYCVTDAWFTVALFNQLASENPCAFGGLEHLLIGGDALNPSIVGSVLASDTPPAHIWNGYGPTENTTFTTLHLISAEDCQREAIPIGRPVSGTVCYVLDQQHRLLPSGVPGELYTSGLGLAKGYLNQPEKSAETFIANPFWHDNADNGIATPLMYKTGDRVCWTQEGTLDFLGRTDNQVKIRGYRLEPGEVEHRLCALDEVSQAVVSTQTVNGQKRLVAWIVSSSSATAILKKFRQQVPSYMVPSSLQVVTSLPLTANGKVDKKSLPPASFDAEDSQRTPLQNDAERQLAAIWQQLLQSDRQFYREDNFFNAGGHSLLVIEMTDLIRRRMDKSVSVADVFNSENLGELAGLIQGEQLTHDDDESRMIMKDCQLKQHGFISAAEVRLESLLLTGATGFLGIYLLATLQQRLPHATVYCLVRGEDGAARIRDTAKHYKLVIDEQRIKWLDGDLNQPNLGISDPQWQILAGIIDGIYHCGAWVNHLHRYSTLRAANVNSTCDLLSLCCRERPKQFFYVSTLSAAAQQDHHIAENHIADAPPVKNGYVQSKWVCEKLLSQAFAAGLHGGIYRMGNITGATNHGISNMETNHTLNLIKGCLQQGVAPDWPGYELDISPVNILSALMVDNSIQRSWPDCALNLGHITTVAWHDLLAGIAARADYALEFVSADEWATRWVPQVDSENALFPFKSFYLTSRYYRRETIDHVLVTETDYKVNLTHLLKIYTDFWMKSGFLPRQP